MRRGTKRTSGNFRTSWVQESPKDNEDTPPHKKEVKEELQLLKQSRQVKESDFVKGKFQESLGSQTPSGHRQKELEDLKNNLSRDPQTVEKQKRAAERKAARGKHAFDK